MLFDSVFASFDSEVLSWVDGVELTVDDVVVVAVDDEVFPFDVEFVVVDVAIDAATDVVFGDSAGFGTVLVAGDDVVDSDTTDDVLTKSAKAETDEIGRSRFASLRCRLPGTLSFVTDVVIVGVIVSA